MKHICVRRDLLEITTQLMAILCDDVPAEVSNQNDCCFDMVNKKLRRRIIEAAGQIDAEKMTTEQVARGVANLLYAALYPDELNYD